jgi:antitoxin component of RelBE/YafQ-DinJ toxin-antitoxin module
MIMKPVDSVHKEPNDVTLEAIKEARAGKFAGVIDTSSMEAFIKSFSGLKIRTPKRRKP